MRKKINRIHNPLISQPRQNSTYSETCYFLSIASLFSSFSSLLLFPSSCPGIFPFHRHAFNLVVSWTIFSPFHRQKILSNQNFIEEILLAEEKEMKSTRMTPFNIFQMDNHHKCPSENVLSINQKQ